MSLVFSNNLRSAYITEIVRTFQRLKPKGYLGRTALQKLVYFCKAIGVPIPCSYEIYNYGPYSEEVTRSVAALLADDAISDVSAVNTYSSYKLGGEAGEFDSEFTEQIAEHQDAIEIIVGALGDTKPETLELIATLHFVNAKLFGITGKRPTEGDVQLDFRSIKGDKFSQEDIDMWYRWLDECGLLGP
jgi:uncharacterized protein YwgA